MWDNAAAIACERIQSHAVTRELRDLVYILEHLMHMLPEEEKGGTVLEVVFADGDAAWNE